MFIKKWVVLCLILGFAQGVLFAATYQDISELGTSAGMIGRGNVGGFSDTASGLLENPVGMSRSCNSVSAFYTQLFGDIDYVTGAVSHQVTPEITVGIGAVVEINPNNDITSTNDANEVISEGTFIAYTSQAILGADFKLAKDLNLGITWTQYTRKQSDLEGSGGDLGLGVRYAHTSGEFLVYGKNILGKSMTYNTDTSEKFAPETGMAYKSPPIQELHNTEFFGQIRYLSDDNILLKGIGIRIYPLDNPYLGLSLGYKDKQQAGSAMRSLLSAGVSLSLGNLRFDYAYDTTDVYQQENQHYFSMSLQFPMSEHHPIGQTKSDTTPVAKTPVQIPSTVPIVVPKKEIVIATEKATQEVMTTSTEATKTSPAPPSTKESIPTTSSPAAPEIHATSLPIDKPRPIAKVATATKPSVPVVHASPATANPLVDKIDTIPVLQTQAPVVTPQSAPTVWQSLGEIVITVVSGIWKILIGFLNLFF